jgi:hypothetical protein
MAEKHELTDFDHELNSKKLKVSEEQAEKVHETREIHGKETSSSK